MVTLDQLETDHFQEIIDLMSREFDSHDFVNALVARYKTLYDQAVRETNGTDPLMQLNMQIGRRLLNRNDITKIGQNYSLNNREKKSVTSLWRKK